MKNTRVLFRGHYLCLKKQAHWEYCERNGVGGAVVILALTPDENVLFVEQYRIPLGARSIEMPAGLIGDTRDFAGESAESAARRELEEETGYRAGRMRILMSGPSSAGLSNEIITLAYARDLVRVGPGGGDASEAIQVHEVPLTECHDWLMKQAAGGLPIDPKVFGGLYWLERLEHTG